MKFLKYLSLVAILTLNHVVSNAQNCTLTCPANMLIKADKGQEGAIVNFPSASTSGECGTVIFSPASGTFFRLGSHSITVTSSNGQKCSFTLTVTDNESPVLSPITLSAKKLWPANNKIKKVAVFYTATDNGQNVTSNLSVTSNNTESIAKDFEVVNNHLVRLKASRLPNGEPRIYTITVTSTDEAGNKTTRSTSIAVSKTMVAK